jgi:hypothetical protein
MFRPTLWSYFIIAIGTTSCVNWDAGAIPAASTTYVTLAVPRSIHSIDLGQPAPAIQPSCPITFRTARARFRSCESLSRDSFRSAGAAAGPIDLRLRDPPTRPQPPRFLNLPGSRGGNERCHPRCIPLLEFVSTHGVFRHRRRRPVLPGPAARQCRRSAATRVYSEIERRWQGSTTGTRICLFFAFG